jgi:hypothetical protein
MTTINDSKAMSEIRNKLSEELKKMTPEEQIAHIKTRAEELEKEYGFKLRRQVKTKI